MTSTDVAIVVFLSCGLMEFIYGIHIAHQRQALKQKLLVEFTRTCFAETRLKLMELLRTGGIEHQSKTFCSLYVLLTYVVRRPDKYSELSNIFYKAIFGPDEATPGDILAERASWTPEIREIIKSTAIGLGMLIYLHSPIRKFLFELERLSSKTVSFAASLVRVFVKLILPLAERDDQRRPQVIEIRRAQSVLLAAAA